MKNSARSRDRTKHLPYSRKIPYKDVNYAIRYAMHLTLRLHAIRVLALPLACSSVESYELGVFIERIL